MASVLHFDSRDERIMYGTGWIPVIASGVGNTLIYTSSSTLGAKFFFLFRGTSIIFYSRSDGGGGNLTILLDTNTTIVSLNGTSISDGPTLAWSADNLGDGDHQLSVWVNYLQQDGSVAVDSFEIENSSGKGFDLLSAGPNAANVPKEAIIVDNSSPDIILSNASDWSNSNDVAYYKGSALTAIQPDAWLNFSFNGVAIWFYSDIERYNPYYSVSIDGSEPERFNPKSNGGQLTQQMLWSKMNLTPGRHNFTLRRDSVNAIGASGVSLDFFRVLGANNASSSTPTGTGATTPESKSNTVPLAVGLTLGLLGLLGLAIGAFYLQRRWRNQPAPVDAPEEPPKP